MKKIYISKPCKTFCYWWGFRGKLYPVFPDNIRHLESPIAENEDINILFDNGKKKRLGKLSDFELVDLSEFYK